MGLCTPRVTAAASSAGPDAPRAHFWRRGSWFEHQTCLSVSESGVAGSSGEEEGVGEEKTVFRSVLIISARERRKRLILNLLSSNVCLTVFYT